MTNVVHVLPQTGRRTLWIVRSEGQADLVLATREKALAHARAIAQSRLTRSRLPIVVRIWDRKCRREDEVMEPAAEPPGEMRRRKLEGSGT